MKLSVSQQWQTVEGVSSDEEKFDTLAVPLTHPPLPYCPRPLRPPITAFFNVNAVKAHNDFECEEIKCSTLYGEHSDMDEASPHPRLLAHVTNIHEHDKEVNICEVAGVDALNPEVAAFADDSGELVWHGLLFFSCSCWSR